MSDSASSPAKAMTAAQRRFFGNLMDDIERVCGYWLKDFTEVETEQYVDGEFGERDHITRIQLTEDDSDAEPVTVGFDELQRGLTMLVSLETQEKWWHCGDASKPVTRLQVLLAQDNDDETAAIYDACIADDLVQLAVLGEITYS